MPLFQSSKNSDSKRIKSEIAISSIKIKPFWENLHDRQEYKQAKKADRAEYLRFIMEVVKQDLVIHAATGLLSQDTRHSSNYFPIDDLSSGEATISFEGNTVVSHAYYHQKFFPAILDVLRNGFLAQMNDTVGLYIPEWKLILILNGVHHSAVASVLKEHGEAFCRIVHANDIVTQRSLSADMHYWCLPDGKEIPVEEPRFALLYLISKELNALGGFM